MLSGQSGQLVGVRGQHYSSIPSHRSSHSGNKETGLRTSETARFWVSMVYCLVQVLNISGMVKHWTQNADVIHLQTQEHALDAIWCHCMLQEQKCAMKNGWNWAWAALALYAVFGPTDQWVKCATNFNLEKKSVSQLSKVWKTMCKNSNQHHSLYLQTAEKRINDASKWESYQASEMLLKPHDYTTSRIRLIQKSSSKQNS